jgi:hypothetical protein
MYNKGFRHIFLKQLGPGSLMALAGSLKEQQLSLIWVL